MGHDNANEDPQTDEATHEVIGPSPIPETKLRRKKKITTIDFDRSPTKTLNKVWSPWIQGHEPRNIKDWVIARKDDWNNKPVYRG